MKTLKRAVIAVVVIAGSVHAAPLAAAATADRVEQASAVTSPAPSNDTAPVAAVAVELQQRIERLERELTRLRAQEDERARLVVEPDPTFFDG